MQQPLTPPETHTEWLPLRLRVLGQQDYEKVWRDMQRFTTTRTADTSDELWLLEHPPVFTQGLNGKPEHLLYPAEIPVVQVDRGGQVTYHGPGQVVAYLLADLQRRKLGIRPLVTLLEQAVIELLADYGITAQARRDAPGVYVEGRKIAALGLRVRRGCCYHGLSLNVDMDLTPFSRINPCGYQGLEVTRMKDFGVMETAAQIQHKLSGHLARVLGYTMQPVNND